MLTAAQLEARKHGIGASDIAAICGVSRWGSPMRVYLDKIGASEPLEQTEAMYWGSVNERNVVRRFGEEHPEYTVVYRPKALPHVHPAHPWAMATPDALLDLLSPTHQHAGLEVKTASAYKREEWDGDSPPVEYVLQCQWSMCVLGYDKWYLAVLIGGNEYREFVVERDDELIAELLLRGRAFWTLVENRTPPAIDGSEDSTRVLATMYPADEAVEDAVNLPAGTDELAKQHKALKAQAKAIEAELALVDNQLKAALAEHVVGYTPAGYTVKWSPRSRAVFNAKALLAEHPKLGAKYQGTTQYRQLAVLLGDTEEEE